MRKGILAALAVTIGLATHAQPRKTVYEIGAGNLSPQAVDTYPQQLLRVVEQSDTAWRVIVSTFAVAEDMSRFGKVAEAPYDLRRQWPDSLARYLEPTWHIDPRHPGVQAIADTLFGGETSAREVIGKGLRFTSQFITFDNDLAMQLDAGNCVTLDINTILERRTGTCSEYTNLFLALMRARNIPCRMAVGYISMPEQDFEGSHAWAECYLEGYGWLAVDPQNGFYGFPPVIVKLFHGRDFLDCNIKTLPDMYPVRMRVLDESEAALCLSAEE